MPTKETRRLRGQRRGRILVARAVSELRTAREGANVSLAQLAREAGSSESALSRLERNLLEDVGIVQLSEIASALGLEISVGIHPVGDPIRDKAQLAIGRRFDALLGPAWRVMNEVLLPGPGDRRSWDKVIRFVGPEPAHAVGIEIETRIRDVQALVRRIRERETDRRVDAILIVLGDSSTNRRLADQLIDNLGDAYWLSMRRIRQCLRRGEPLLGSGVILV